MRTQLVLIVTGVLAALIPLTTLAEDAETGAPRSAPKLVVVLKRGETKQAQMCWAEGTGRMPVVFLTYSPEMCVRTRKNLRGEPLVSDRGVTVQFDEKESESVQAELNSAAQETGSNRVLTAVSVRLSAADDAVPGVQSKYLSVVSGTGRDMLLSGEIRIIVRE